MAASIAWRARAPVATMLVLAVVGACSRGRDSAHAPPPGGPIAAEQTTFGQAGSGVGATTFGRDETTFGQVPEDLSAGWLDGTWIAGGRDRFHLVVEVSGDHAIVTGLDGEVHYDGTLVAKRVERGYYRVGSADGAFEVHAFVRGADEVVGILYGENGLAEARRVRAMPEELVGDWVVGFSDNYHLAGGTAEFEERSWRVRVGGRDARSGQALSLGTRAGALEVALQTSPDHLELTTFVRTPGDTWLAWIRGTDQHMVLHPADARPAWIPERTPRIPLGGAE